jgi:hypothetical protein
MVAMPNWLDRFFIALRIKSQGTTVAQRAALDFAGAGVTVTDVAVDDLTRITVNGVAVGLTGTETTDTPDAGPAEALPATPKFYLEVTVNGEPGKIPIY